MTHHNSRIGIKTRTGSSAVLKSVALTGRLDGLLLEMRFWQHYRNDSAADIEAVYSFPLAHGARLLGLNVTIAGKKLRGAVVPRAQAQRDYETAIEKGDTPVMVEQSSEGICTANLGNLRPGEDALLDLRYAQLLRFEQGRVRLVVPTVIAPRHGDAHGEGALATHESPAADISAEYPFTFAIEIYGDIAATRITSPSHPIALRDISGGRSVSLAPGSAATLDRDFVLVLNGLEASGRTFALVAPDNFADPGADSANNTPAHTVLASFCPSLPRENHTPLLLKILVDCSGSMAGDSIRSAREALHRVLAELAPRDYVSLSRFGNIVRHESRQLESSSRATIRHLAATVSRMEADMGGTELRAALLSTYNDIAAPTAPPADNSPRPSVLLITDGAIWNTEEILDDARRSGHRIFVVGVGSAPAESLHRAIAHLTGGACEMVSPNENAADAIVRMFHRLRSTATEHVRIDWGEGEKPFWQSSLPQALYDGETLNIFAQFSTPPPRPPQLCWRDAAGATHTLRARSLSPAHGDTIPRLAGAAKLDATSPDAAREKIALRYQLLSKQTNLLLVHIRDENDKAGALPTLGIVPQTLAAGWGGIGTVTRRHAPAIHAQPDDLQVPYYSTEPILNSIYDGDQAPGCTALDIDSAGIVPAAAPAKNQPRAAPSAPCAAPSAQKSRSKLSAVLLFLLLLLLASACLFILKTCNASKSPSKPAAAHVEHLAPAPVTFHESTNRKELVTP